MARAPGSTSSGRPAASRGEMTEGGASEVAIQQGRSGYQTQNKVASRNHKGPRAFAAPRFLRGEPSSRSNPASASILPPSASRVNAAHVPGCGRRDSNPHGLSPRNLPSCCVYQFRHARTTSAQRRHWRQRRVPASGECHWRSQDACDCMWCRSTGWWISTRA